MPPATRAGRARCPRLPPAWHCLLPRAPRQRLVQTLTTAVSAGPVNDAVESQPAPSTVPGAIQLLERGEEARAKSVLQDILARTPNNSTARRLFSQIEGDPKTLLGTKFERYRVRPGDTLSLIAKRFAGDPLLFYALARHNGIPVPIELAANTVIEVPAIERRVQPNASKVVETDAARVSEPDASPEGRARDAATLRRAGLKELNKGSIERAVAYFRRAHILAPDDAAIASDLERAERVLRTVRAADD